MTVTELIEQRLNRRDSIVRIDHQREHLKHFAIELLELMRAKTEFGEPVRHTHEAIDKALEELRK